MYFFVLKLWTDKYEHLFIPLCILDSCYDLQCVKVCAKILPFNYLQQMACSATDDSTYMSGGIFKADRGSNGLCF